MKTKNYFLLFFLICLFFSCKKESSPSWTKDHFVDSDWIITSKILKSNTLDPNAKEEGEITFLDVWETESDCAKDDIFRFNSDRSHERTAGLNDCSVTGNNPLPQSWRITPERFIEIFTTDSNGEESIIWNIHLNKFGDQFFEGFAPEIFLGAIGPYESVVVIRFEKLN